jgi:hypothetical protein
MTKINSMKSMALLLGFWFLQRMEGGRERRAELGHVGESSDHGRTGEKEKCRPRWDDIIGSAGSWSRRLSNHDNEALRCLTADKHSRNRVKRISCEDGLYRKICATTNPRHSLCNK